jgi:hypothetical protein
MTKLQLKYIINTVKNFYNNQIWIYRSTNFSVLIFKFKNFLE